jgi:hypothetical protein
VEKRQISVKNYDDALIQGFFVSLYLVGRDLDPMFLGIGLFWARKLLFGYRCALPRIVR